jgi:hypothetical protein
LCKRTPRLSVVSNRPVERWRNLGPVRASWSIAGVVVLRISFVDCEALKDEGGNCIGSLVVEIGETGESIQSFPFNPIEAAEHHSFLFSFLEKAVDGLPFEAGPFLRLIVLAQNGDDEVRLIVVERGKIQGEVAARELGLVVFVVEDVVLAEAFREGSPRPVRQSPAFPRQMKRQYGNVCSCDASSDFLKSQAKNTRAAIPAKIGSGKTSSIFSIAFIEKALWQWRLAEL